MSLTLQQPAGAQAQLRGVHFWEGHIGLHGRMLWQWGTVGQASSRVSGAAAGARGHAVCWVCTALRRAMVVVEARQAPQQVRCLPAQPVIPRTRQL